MINQTFTAIRFYRGPRAFACLRHSIVLLVLLSGFVVSFSAHAADWRNLWSTPEQRALQQIQEGEFEALANDAPSNHWQGLGAYKQKQFDAAAKAFAATRADEQTSAVYTRSLYNEATAQVQNAQYEEAIALYDTLLAEQPDHQSALHNRAIAEQLLQLDQESQQQQSGEDSSQQNQQEQDEKQPQEGESNQDEAQSEQSSKESQDSQQSDQQKAQDGQSSEAESEEQRAAEEAAAKAALEAERQAQQQLSDEGEEPDAADEENIAAVESMSEREQANEQWLKQIVDDPAGLLQRKLQNSHSIEFPEVNNSAKPW